MKKYIFLFITLFINIFLIYFIYNGPLVLKKFEDVINNNQFMLMGSGEINGDTFTNSIDALKHNKEHSIFEVDLSMTSDKKIVLASGWLLTDYKQNIGIKYYGDSKNFISAATPPDYETFMRFKIQDKYTASDLSDLVSFMKDNKDTYIYLDIEFHSESYIKDILKEIIKECNKDILNRFIIHIYNKDMLNVIKKYNQFKLLSMKYDYNNFDGIDEFIDYCNDNNIKIINTSLSGINKEKVKLLKDNDLIIIVNDISRKEEAQMLKSWNVDLIGSYNLK